MELSDKDQIKFAREILAIINAEEADIKTISHLKHLTSLLVRWAGHNNGIAIDLDEYVGELYAIKKNDGTGNVEWKEEYKKRVEEDIADSK